MMDCKREFLIGYDYGAGGLWGIMAATGREEILEVYPELYVVEITEAPSWMDVERLDDLRNREWHDIDGAPWGILNVVIADRDTGR